MSRGRRKQPVFLNVYDLAEFNNYGHFFGVGVYHSGVEVGGSEYTFGGHDRDCSGVFVTEPRHAPGARFREAILMGETDLSSSEIQRLADSLGSDFIGNRYDLLRRNCNHFSEVFCQRLVGRSIPTRVNRLAWWGTMFSCLLPANLGVQAPAAPAAGTDALASTPGNFSAFAGSGVVLAGPVETSIDGPSTGRAEDPELRRKRLADAAARRLENRK